LPVAVAAFQHLISPLRRDYYLGIVPMLAITRLTASQMSRSGVKLLLPLHFS
jgi:hypothetical protein